MDDFLLWSDSKQSLLAVKNGFANFFQQELKLNIKPVLIQRSAVGILFCGIGIKPFSLRASVRRRYKNALKYYHKQWQHGEIDSRQLQRAYAAVNSILLPATEKSWRRQCLKTVAAVDA